MNTTENKEQDSKPVYEPPRLDIISLRAEEAMAIACKNIGLSGADSTDCLREFSQIPCTEPAS
jgi:hypothetical protein